MAVQIGKVSIEVMREVEIVKNVEVDGKVEEIPEKINLRFDLLVPLGTPFEVLHGVIKEFDEVVTLMEETNKKQHDNREQDNPATEESDGKE